MEGSSARPDNLPPIAPWVEWCMQTCQPWPPGAGQARGVPVDGHPAVLEHVDLRALAVVLVLDRELDADKLVQHLHGTGKESSAHTTATAVHLLQL